VAAREDRVLAEAVTGEGVAPWRLVTDGVMGGVSGGRVERAEVAGRPCVRLTGEVRLENNGGFVQIALHLAPGGASLDASGFAGVRLRVYGNGERYGVHLRTADLWLPWQSFRAGFDAEPEWREVRIPFSAFTPYRTGKALDPARLTRLGVFAIGRAFRADVCVAGVSLYR
jgi:hypothetical protein